MFIVQINDIDCSCHTQEVDALTQKQILLSLGNIEDDTIIVEKDTFDPPQSEL